MRHCVAVLVPIIAGLAGLLQVRAQTINTLAGGGGTPGYSGDNGQAAEARINFARGVAVDRQGNVFIADTENHRIRKVTNNVITTVAGTGTEGTSADTGLLATAARLSFPRAVAVDQAGNLYIADTGNSKIHKVGTDGRISKIAGMTTAGFSGDGGSATLAQLNNPRSLVVDSAGNIYVADGWNFRIRKITAAGIIQPSPGTELWSFRDGGLQHRRRLLIGRCSGLKDSLSADSYNHRSASSTHQGRSPQCEVVGPPPKSTAHRHAPSQRFARTPGDLSLGYPESSVRKVSTAEIMGTVAERRGGFSGDGAAASEAS